MKEIKGTPGSAALFLFLAGLLCVFSGKSFLDMHRPEPIFPRPGLSEIKKLGDYLPALQDSAGDTDVYVFRGKEKGGNLLAVGGTHPNEPAGLVTTVLLIETIRAVRGDIFIIPRANASGFTHSDPQEGNPQRFSISTPAGPRRFRLGSRLTNPVDQWPDPAVYMNPPGQKLSGNEARNLNRCYPGRAKGHLTEKIAFGIMELIRKEKIDIAIDFHESAPEYPVINAIVFHENSAELAALAVMELQAAGIEIRLEASPVGLRGLSHREWGDEAGIKVLLLETPNASHGRLKGRPSSSLVVEGRDKFYARAARLGWLFVPFGEEGIPLSQRVARHLAAISALLKSLAELEPDKAIAMEGMPPSADVQQKGLGVFLHPPLKGT
ncbi:MAG: succinylglutamate desuccinylase/aspartoacylase family protein [Candidatus Aminicenantes bacterium]|nr:succinylglutamate desuccinylase/aspartoacylase family protein [Candidatus Aminicenantes bacterium]